jgi:transcriptional repressor NrdR
MRCPKCGCLDDKVIETRVSRDGDTIRRRRECASCTFRFTTREGILPAEIVVVKRDGSREDFSADKLRDGIRQACWKRPVEPEEVDRAVGAITARLAARQDREVSSQEIGELAMDALQAIDEVAYVRFASVYRRFKRIDQFINEVHSLNDRQQRHPALFPDD